MSDWQVGIDLGTTNCALSYWNEETVLDFAIPQLVAPAQLETRPTLPSYLYIPSRHEIGVDDLSLPWDEVADWTVGVLARDEGAKVPDRLISSAKSWLSQDGVDRRAPILPWKAPEEVTKISPVEVSTRYLKHLAQAWRFSRLGTVLEELDVVLTVPASFDAIARELTVEAANRAGLEKLTLLEEPQAAFYSWLDANQDTWRQHVLLGDRILICDLGGGTCDFTLIDVSERSGELELERVAVGDHLLLGGDNMDLALAVQVQQRLKADGHKLDHWQFQVLTFSCRNAKEKLLINGGLDLCNLTIQGRGSSLIGGAIQTELRRADVEKVLLEGFFPVVEATDFANRSRRFGLSELGLTYESDPAITRQLARFLGQRKGAAPTCVLFNGGVCQSKALRARLVEQLNHWFPVGVRVLPNHNLDLAVARGAAVYGKVRKGQGIRIRGGTSRSYYIGVEMARPAIPGMAPPTKAVCVAPHGMEEGSRVALEGHEFGLVLGETVEFPFLSSTLRPDDPAGFTVEDWEEGDEIHSIASVTSRLARKADESEAAPVEPAIEEEKIIPVSLEAAVTEIGTLELWCLEKGGEGRWKLEFQVREPASR
jgi:molecular chaperone DnaK (HSP70)